MSFSHKLFNSRSYLGRDKDAHYVISEISASKKVHVCKRETKASGCRLRKNNNENVQQLNSDSFGERNLKLPSLWS